MKKRTFFFLWALMFFLLFFMKTWNILQGALAKTESIIFFTTIFTILLFYAEQTIKRNQQQTCFHYKNLDLARYICSIFIIILHLRPFFGLSDQLDLAFNNIISRVCVPFFFFLTGYFSAKKEQTNPNYITQYIKSTLTVYLIWSLFYLPFLLGTIIDFWPTITATLAQMHLSYFLIIPLIPLILPLFFLITLTYSGVYYHLWYFPALLLSLWVLKKWKKKHSIKILLLLSFLLLLFGATETYYGVLPSDLKKLVSNYFQLFFTTRNFLFFGLFYVVFGYHTGKKDPCTCSLPFLKFILSAVLFVIECLLLQGIERLNSNILLFCIPLIYYGFMTLISANSLLFWKPKYSLRTWSKYYYLTHPMILYFASRFAPITWKEHFIWYLCLILVGTHLISYGCILLKKRIPSLIL